MPVFGLFEPDLWSLSALRLLFQQADTFSAVRMEKVTLVNTAVNDLLSFPTTASPCHGL